MWTVFLSWNYELKPPKVVCSMHACIHGDARVRVFVFVLFVCTGVCCVFWTVGFRRFSNILLFLCTFVTCRDALMRASRLSQSSKVVGPWKQNTGLKDTKMVVWHLYIHVVVRSVINIKIFQREALTFAVTCWCQFQSLCRCQILWRLQPVKVGETLHWTQLMVHSSAPC